MISRHSIYKSSCYPRQLIASSIRLNACSPVLLRTSRHTFSDVVVHPSEQLRSIMRKVPQPIVVVTTAHDGQKRGVTVSSFTSISLEPPLVSFCIRLPSKLSTLLHSSDRFVLHILTTEQVNASIAFSSNDPNADQDSIFESLPHSTKEGVPILDNTVGAMQCTVEKTLKLGDHELWIGKVDTINSQSENAEPLIYYLREYRTVGDQLYMDAFENTTLSWKEWTHRNHLRLAFNYLTTYPAERAIPLIHDGIKKYNNANRKKLPFACHETITGFYIHMLKLAIDTDNQNNISLKTDTNDHSDFHAFLARYRWLADNKLHERFYSREFIYSEKAKTSFQQPDLKPIPTSLPSKDLS